MIERIRCIKNLGPFERVEGVELGKVTLIYGENGRGKTMLSDMILGHGREVWADGVGSDELGE